MSTLGAEGVEGITSTSGGPLASTVARATGSVTAPDWPEMAQDSTGSMRRTRTKVPAGGSHAPLQGPDDVQLPRSDAPSNCEPGGTKNSPRPVQGPESNPYSASKARGVGAERMRTVGTTDASTVTTAPVRTAPLGPSAFKYQRAWGVAKDAPPATSTAIRSPHTRTADLSRAPMAQR
jgi:hypothetical protein